VRESIFQVKQQASSSIWSNVVGWIWALRMIGLIWSHWVTSGGK